MSSDQLEVADISFCRSVCLNNVIYHELLKLQAGIVLE